MPEKNGMKIRIIRHVIIVEIITGSLKYVFSVMKLGKLVVCRHVRLQITFFNQNGLLGKAMQALTRQLLNNFLSL